MRPPDKLEIRNRITKYLMYLIVPLGELHTLWKDATYKVDPWLSRTFPVDVRWFVKFSMDQLTWIIACVVLIRAFRIQDLSLRVASWMLCVFFLFDSFRFIDDFKKSGAYLIYYAAFPFIGVLVENMVRSSFFWRVGQWLQMKCWQLRKEQEAQGSDTTKLNSSKGAKYKYFGTEASNSDRADLRRISFIDKSMIKQ